MKLHNIKQLQYLVVFRVNFSYFYKACFLPVVVDFVESLIGLEAGTTSGLSSDLAVGASGATIL